LGHPEVHRNAETVRHSTRPLRSLLCLRRVWVPIPIPPYTITFQPSSTGTALVSRVIVSHPSGASGVHEDPMVSVLKTYQSLGGPDRISSQKGDHQLPCHDSTSPGITNTPVHLSHIPATGNSRKGCLGHTPSARLAPKTRRRILSNRLNPHHTPKTHAMISPCLISSFTKFMAPRALRTYVSPSPASHHRYNASKSKAVNM
jgi:hypothetical protein